MPKSVSNNLNLNLRGIPYGVNSSQQSSSQSNVIRSSFSQSPNTLQTNGQLGGISSYNASRNANSNSPDMTSSTSIDSWNKFLDDLCEEAPNPANSNLTNTTNYVNFWNNFSSLNSNTHLSVNTSSTNTANISSSSISPANNVTQSPTVRSLKQPNSITKITEGKLKELGQETKNKKAYMKIKSIGCSWSKTAYLKNISLLCDIEEDNYRHTSSLNSQNAQEFNFSLRLPDGSQELNVLREKETDNQGNQYLKNLKITSSKVISADGQKQQGIQVPSQKQSTKIRSKDFNILLDRLQQEQTMKKRSVHKPNK